MPMYLIDGLGPIIVLDRPFKAWVWKPEDGQPDWWRALKRRGVRFIIPDVNPDGVPFIVVTSGASKMYLEFPRGSLNGWLIERMGDGSWALDRKATKRDCLAIFDADPVYTVIGSGDLAANERPDPRPIRLIPYL